MTTFMGTIIEDKVTLWKGIQMGMMMMMMKETITHAGVTTLLIGILVTMASHPVILTEEVEEEILEEGVVTDLTGKTLKRVLLRIIYLMVI